MNVDQQNVVAGCGGVGGDAHHRVGRGAAARRRRVLAQHGAPGSVLSIQSFPCPDASPHPEVPQSTRSSRSRGGAAANKEARSKDVRANKSTQGPMLELCHTDSSISLLPTVVT